MSLTTAGKAPGPVRFYLACDRMGCRERVSFDLVIAEEPPDRGTDLFGYLLHEAGKAAPYIRDCGWVFIEGGEGYWCPKCSAPASRAPSADRF
ncbi:hypothetical protein V1L54_28050 [Streptomyces sp. TRM 70361]|uniref:hypothetical protein n=1 Tax=Streptomyces sp. TRM 70361 TaxID=3116553 RepID=UPI002E7B7E90|nr:hypothetical protein [Streptomyces sp. TRM 70361]MEE1943210.1 hypothetical protein [Streptomyces sp. TRM 70361]